MGKKEEKGEKNEKNELRRKTLKGGYPIYYWTDLPGNSAEET